MRSARITLAAVIVAGLTAAVGGEQPPGPSPEQKKLDVFMGTWAMAGTAEAAPWSPAGPITGTMTCRWFAGGFHIVCDADETGPMGRLQSHSVFGYSVERARYENYGIDSMGFGGATTGTLASDVWTFEGSETIGGKSFSFRMVLTVTSPGEFAWKGSYSDDGATWKATGAGKGTKRD
jgi:hypothetical protein